MKVRSENPTNRLRTNVDLAVAAPWTAWPPLEFDAARVAISEPSPVIEPIDVAEHCVLCFFQEVIAELVPRCLAVLLWMACSPRGICAQRQVFEVDFTPPLIVRVRATPNALRGHGSSSGWSAADCLSPERGRSHSSCGHALLEGRAVENPDGLAHLHHAALMPLTIGWARLLAR